MSVAGVAQNFLETRYGENAPPVHDYPYMIYHGGRHLFNLNVRGNGHPPEISDYVRQVLEENNFHVPSTLRDLCAKSGMSAGSTYLNQESEPTRIYLN